LSCRLDARHILQCRPMAQNFFKIDFTTHTI